MSLTSPHTKALQDILSQARENAGYGPLVAFLDARRAEILIDLRRVISARIPAYSQSGNPDVLPELEQHCEAHTESFLAWLGDEKGGDFEFVRAYASRLAEQRFPLEAALHAYRLCHKEHIRWIRQSLTALPEDVCDNPRLAADLSDFALEYADAVSTAAAGSYIKQSRLIAEVASDQRSELLTILLDGFDESDGRVASLLRGAGYLERRQAYCVAVACSVNPAEMLNRARARRMAESIDDMMEGVAARRLIDVRDNKVVIVFSAPRRASGWTTPNSALAERLIPALRRVGNAVLLGVSNDVPSTSQIPRAYAEAVHALSLADTSTRVVQLSDISLRRLLIHLAADRVQSVLPAWSQSLFEADDKSGGALSDTLKVYGDADMNVLKAAAALSIHPNTLYARFQKIRDITGQDARRFHVLSEMLVVLGCRARE